MNDTGCSGAQNANISASAILKIALDENRTLVLAIEDNSSISRSWAETVESGRKWMAFFRQLGIAD